MWPRPGLERAARSTVNISVLCALGRIEEPKSHIRMALSNGLTREELKEIVLQVGVYAGVPTAVTRAPQSCRQGSGSTRATSPGRGVRAPRARRRPLRVALASTGLELFPAGAALAPGRIHDSNRPMLRALLAGPSVALTDMGILPDDPARIRDALLEARDTADMIVTSGGVSVGEEDHVVRALSEAGGSIGALRLPVKPGKPAKFGRLSAAVFLGLPGNPLAAFAMHHLVGRMIVDTLLGARVRPIPTRPARAGSSEERKPGQLEPAPVRIVGADEAGLPVIERLGGGGSARLLPLAVADGLCAIGAAVARVERGDRLVLLPV